MPHAGTVALSNISDQPHFTVLQRASDAARLTRLGASRMADYNSEDSRWSTFQDVEGNESDLVDVTGSIGPDSTGG
jgi:hypothetical protein